MSFSIIQNVATNSDIVARCICTVLQSNDFLQFQVILSPFIYTFDTFFTVISHTLSSCSCMLTSFSCTLPSFSGRLKSFSWTLTSFPSRRMSFLSSLTNFPSTLPSFSSRLTWFSSWPPSSLSRLMSFPSRIWTSFSWTLTSFSCTLSNHYLGFDLDQQSTTRTARKYLDCTITMSDLIATNDKWKMFSAFTIWKYYKVYE